MAWQTWHDEINGMTILSDQKMAWKNMNGMTNFMEVQKVVQKVIQKVTHDKIGVTNFSPETILNQCPYTI